MFYFHRKCFARIFQFHKGAIRTYSQSYFSLFLKNFNSIKVRLEPEGGFSASYLSVFQFHKGAIRTGGGRSPHRTNNLFQFHKGAIRTNAFINFKFILANFNSIKVRLERRKRRGRPRWSKFQFHKGAIRTTISSLPISRISVISIP